MEKKLVRLKDSGLRKLSLTDTERKRCKMASQILKYAHDSASALLRAFEISRRLRGGPDKPPLKEQGEPPNKPPPTRAPPRGMTTDQEQDLLRAMLVMASSGLDAMVKQLVRDALPLLAEDDSCVREELKKFVERKLRGMADSPDAPSVRFLARTLAAPSALNQIIEDYIEELTRGSLQSKKELFRVTKALGLSESVIPVDQQKLDDIFDIRNQIIHEFDSDLKARTRKRHLRKLQDMLDYTNRIFSVGEAILKAVAVKLLRQTIREKMRAMRARLRRRTSRSRIARPF